MKHLLLFALLAATARAEMGNITFTGAIRTPKQEYRTVDGVQKSNPADWLLEAGIDDNTGIARGGVMVSHERENGVYYTGQRYHAKLTTRWFETGWALTDLPDDNLYRMAWHAEMKRMDGHLGLGFTRQYFGKWTQRGTWMARTSITYDDVQAGIAAVRLRFVYERAKSRERISGLLAVTSWAFGPEDRLRLVPTAEYERLDDGSEISTRYKAALVFTVGI